MRAITVSSYGARPSVTELPAPRPGPGQVLIAVRAAGMNPMDMAIASGGWQDQMPARFPMVLGADLAGTVGADGPGAARFAPGDEVFGQLLPITRVSLDDVPALLARPTEGKTVITM